MRAYFDFKLKGSQLFAPIFVGILIISGLATWQMLLTMSQSPETMTLDWHFAVSQLIALAFGFCISLVNVGVMFFVVKAFIEAVSYGDERFECGFDLKEFALIALKGILLSTITLGIYYPWFYVKMIRYFAGNTSFRSNTFNFNGNPGVLFGISVLFLVLPLTLVFGMGLFGYLGIMAGGTLGTWFIVLFCIMSLASLFCSLIYPALICKWFIDFSYGPKKISSTINIWHMAFFFLGQFFLVLITLGFYAPMYVLRTYRYVVSRLVLGQEEVEDKFGFTLNAGKDYWFFLGQYLLSIITLFIYIPWAYSKMATRLVTHTYVEVVEEQKIPMPKEL